LADACHVGEEGEDVCEFREEEPRCRWSIHLPPAVDEQRIGFCLGRGDDSSALRPALTLTAEAMVQRLVALVPPRGLHLTCFHGVFAPNAGLRAAVMLPSPPSPPTTAAATPPQKTRRPRLDWATALQRTFGIDVWTCHCGGKRIVRAVITRRATAQAILCSLGLAPAPTRASAQSPPQLHLPY
jgi:hypothetical protein